MFYLILFFVVIAYFKFIKTPDDFKSFCLYFLPVGILLILIIGLQDGVGADYESYIELVKGIKEHPGAVSRNEYLFLGLLELVKFIGVPQLFFVFSAVIQVFFLMLIAYEMHKMKYELYIVFFLYFALLLVFFNMFNAVRQYIAVYMLIYALLIVRDKRYFTAVIVILIGSLFHSAALYFIPILLLRKFMGKRVQFKYFAGAFIICVLISFIDFSEFYKYIISLTPYARSYSGDPIERMSTAGIITKIPKLAVVLFSAFMLRGVELSEKENYLINISYMSCLLLVISITANQLWRLYQYLDFFILIPVVIFMQDRKYQKYSYLIAAGLFAILIVKIMIMPRGEYLYNSILF